MSSSKRRAISEALKRANGSIALIQTMQRTARGRGVRERMARHLREMRRLRRELRIMNQPNSRHSLSSVTTVMGRIVELICEVISLFAPYT